MAFLLVGEGPGNRPLDLSGGICPTASGMIVSNASSQGLFDGVFDSRSHVVQRSDDGANGSPAAQTL